MNPFRKLQFLTLCAFPLMAGCGASSTPSAGQLPLATDVDSVAPGVCTLTRDGYTLAWVQDNAQPRLMERSLFPAASDSVMQALGLTDGVPSTVSTFVLLGDGGTALFDTGLGLPDSRLQAGIQALGLSPADVDHIFLTHFHGDHIGGLAPAGKAAFPRAQLHVPQREYDAWQAMPPEQRAQVEQALAAYEGRISFFQPADTLPLGVQPVEAAGHTPGHTAYRVGPFLIAGDFMHGAALQYAHPDISATYDMDAAAAARARRALLSLARGQGLVLAGMHLPAPAMFSFPASGR